MARRKQIVDRGNFLFFSFFFPSKQAGNDDAPDGMNGDEDRVKA